MPKNKHKNICDMSKRAITQNIVCQVVVAVGGLLVALRGLAVLLQVQLERLHVVLEAQRRHGEKDVLAVDGLPLFRLLGTFFRVNIMIAIFDEKMALFLKTNVTINFLCQNKCQ
jgi:hypothetical protein